MHDITGRMMKGFGLLTCGLFAFNAIANVFWVGSSDGYGDPGDNQSWHDPNNWSGGVTPGETDTVWLGYDDNGNVDDVPQNIQIPETAYVNDAVVYARGDRQVTLSGSPLEFKALFMENALVIHSGAESDTVFEANLGINRRAYFRNQSAHDVIMEGYVFRPTTDPGGGGYEYYYVGAAGNRYRIRGSSTGNAIGHLSSGFVRAETENMRFRWNPQFSGAVLEVPVDIRPTQIYPMSSPVRVRRVGSGDRTVRVDRSESSSTTVNRRVELEHAPDAGPGHMTFQLPGIEAGMYYQIATNVTLAFYTSPLAFRRHIHFQNTTFPAILGDGAIRVNLDTAAQVMEVRRPMAHTGDTWIETGILRLQETLDNGDTFYGSVGPGPFWIATDGAFDLNGIDQTIGALRGAGTVQLGGATLMATNGVSPGTDNVGTLTVAGAGALSLNGPDSRFEFSDTETHDRVVFTGTADLSLGGTVQIVGPEGFADYGSGRYTLIELNGGDILDAFDTLIPPEGMEAEIDTLSGNVEVILSKIPIGTVILLR